MPIEKPIPNQPTPMPALDADRAKNANLAPQGDVNLEDEAPGSKFTPEGDGEPSPNIPDDIV